MLGRDPNIRVGAGVGAAGVGAAGVEAAGVGTGVGTTGVGAASGSCHRQGPSHISGSWPGS